MKFKISVIIPTLNESATIEKTLMSLHTIRGILEILVVDGGSTDNTVQLASNCCQVIHSDRSRALQMNAGARQAKGNILLFLHSDSIVTQEGIDLVSTKIQNPSIVGGGFKIKFDNDSLIFKIIAWGSNIRAGMGRIFFGDQGIFVRKQVFFEVGGYPDIPIMEDWELCRRLKTKGRLVLLPSNILTSSRRWHKQGIWKIIFLMHKLKVLYLLGVKPHDLKKMYSDAR